MIYVVATTEVKPEHREAYIKGAKECVAETQKEAGCIYYDSHVSVNNPNLFVVVERWESRELSAPFKASPTVIEIINPADVIKR
jgi:quinol monooxygenase YgiN